MTTNPAQLPDTTQQLMALLAYVYLEHNRPEKAVVLLRALDVLGLSTPRQMRALAVSQLRAQKPADALATVERMALLGQVDAPFHLIRAQALAALNRAEDARDAMQTYIQQRNTDALPADSGIQKGNA